MRDATIAVVVVLGLPLAGCFGVTLPPKPLPEWAMHPQAYETTPARPRTARTQTPRVIAHRGPPDQSAPVSFVGPLPEVLPFTPEWTAREDAADEKLRRRMNICGGC